MSSYSIASARLLLKRVPGLTSDDICLIVSYTAALEKLKQEIKGTDLEGLRLVDLQTATADSFQGWEARVIIWCLVSANNSGAGFVKMADRICVSITRHGFPDRHRR